MEVAQYLVFGKIPLRVFASLSPSTIIIILPSLMAVKVLYKL